MERTKLKMAVVFLLLMVNLLLLANAGMQYRQNTLYQQAAVTEAMTYLKNHGIQAERDAIPWKSTLSEDAEKDFERDSVFFVGDIIPEGESWMVQPSRKAETLAVDLANELAALGYTDVTLESVAEGYRYESVSRTMFPSWRVTTDRGIFLLDGASGKLTEEQPAETVSPEI